MEINKNISFTIELDENEAWMLRHIASMRREIAKKFEDTIEAGWEADVNKFLDGLYQKL
jgi:hypothetical protein